ncbi:MAG: hypothetical protein WAO09_05265 [Candidatus Dormiibacterota bacterium]|jgi:hypothetical protein
MSSMETPPTYTEGPPATTQPAYTTQPAPVHETEFREAKIVRRPTGPSAHDRLGEPIGLAILIVDLFLALDFVFRAVAASRDGFVNVVDRVGDALAGPFAGIFHDTHAVGHTTYWAALIALIVYTVAALILIRIVHLLTSPRRSRATSS